MRTITAITRMTPVHIPALKMPAIAAHPWTVKSTTNKKAQAVVLFFIMDL